MRPSLMLLFFGLVNSALVKRNVIFQKINAITTTRSRWLITFVIDLDHYEKLLSTLRDDFKIVEESIQTLETMYAATNSRGFLNPETFFIGAIMELCRELVSLNASQEDISNMFVSFQSLRIRNRRSLLPFIGSVKLLIWHRIGTRLRFDQTTC